MELKCAFSESLSSCQRNQGSPPLCTLHESIQEQVYPAVQDPFMVKPRNPAKDQQGNNSEQTAVKGRCPIINGFFGGDLTHSTTISEDFYQPPKIGHFETSFICS